MADRKDELAGKWCILRTAAPRTLLLVEALSAGGVDAWTPTLAEKRKGRGRDRHKQVSVTVPMTPTFVFAPAPHAAELIHAARLRPSPYPPFSVLRRRDHGVALIRDASLTALRQAERGKLKRKERIDRTGVDVRLKEGAFAGMTGVVESDNGKSARVNFGSGFVVQIASYILTDDVVQTANSPAMGIAA